MKPRISLPGTPSGRKKRLQVEQDSLFIRGEHPDKRSNAEWVKMMVESGWNWEFKTKGQSEWKRLNENK